jgi:hypothetical protein
MPIIEAIVTETSTQYYFTPDFASVVNNILLGFSLIQCLILAMVATIFVFMIFKK